MELNISLEEKSLIITGLKEEIKSCQKEIDSCIELDTNGKWASYITFKKEQINNIKELLKRFE